MARKNFGLGIEICEKAECRVRRVGRYQKGPGTQPNPHMK